MKRKKKSNRPKIMLIRKGTEAAKMMSFINTHPIFAQLKKIYFGDPFIVRPSQQAY
jgi:hypothetical protein